MKYSNNTANNTYVGLLKTILNEGQPTSPRGQRTLELVGMRSMFDTNHPVVTNRARKLSYTFMFAEALWILSGSDKVSDIAPYNKNISQFSDDGKVFYGAYGPRVVGQLMYVASKLIQDPDTRQAVMTIWRQNPLPSKDIPCTISTQFIIRHNRLHTIHSMRSSDAWLGYPYDIFNFSMISAWLCIWLRQQGMKELQLGSFVLTAGSQHIYERNFQGAFNVLESSKTNFQYEGFEPSEFQEPEELIEHLELLRDKKFTQIKKSFLKELQSYYDTRTTEA